MLALPRSLQDALGNEGRGLTVEVIRLGAMGDILRTLPAVRLIRRGLPHARLFWVLDRHWSSLLEGHPDLEGLIGLPRQDWNRLSRSPGGWPELRRRLADFRRRLVEPGPGLTIDFHGNLRSGITSRMTGAPVRLGYVGHQQKEGNRLFNTHHVLSGDRRTPRMERNLDLVRALGLPAEPLPESALPLPLAGRDEARRIASELAGDCDGHAVISPGASRAQAYKKPSTALLAAAANRIDGAGLAPLVVFGPGEEDDARRVVESSAGRMAPPTNLPTLAALLESARLFVGGDSGPLHLSCSVGCPVVGVYGPTDPRVNRPWGVPHRVVQPPDRRYTGIKKIDREAGGFAGIAAGQLEAAIDELLGALRAD